MAAGYSPRRDRSSPIRAWAAAPSGCPSAMADSRWSIASRLAKTASLARRPRRMPSPPRPVARLRAHARRSARIASDRPGCPTRGRLAAPRPSAGAGDGDARDSWPRTRRRACGRGRSRSGPTRRPRRRDLADDAAAHQLLDGIDGLLLGSAARLADRREIERATDDRRGRQDLRGRLADGGDPFLEEGTHAPRRQAARGLPAGQRPRPMERQALGIGREMRR